MPPALSVIISSFGVKMKEVQHCLCRGHCRLVNWTNCNIIESQRTGRPKERERDRGAISLWSSQNTRMDGQCLSSSMTLVHGTRKQQGCQRSLVTDHHNKYTNNETSEILQKYQKVTETESDQMLAGKWHQLMCSMQGYHKPLICKQKHQNK